MNKINNIREVCRRDTYKTNLITDLLNNAGAHLGINRPKNHLNMSSLKENEKKQNKKTLYKPEREKFDTRRRRIPTFN